MMSGIDELIDDCLASEDFQNYQTSFGFQETYPVLETLTYMKPANVHFVDPLLNYAQDHDHSSSVNYEIVSIPQQIDGFVATENVHETFPDYNNYNIKDPSTYWPQKPFYSTHYIHTDQEYSSASSSESCFSPPTSPDISNLSISSPVTPTPKKDSKRGRGRPSKPKVKPESEKIKIFRQKKKYIDKLVQKHGWNAIYHGICQSVAISEDYKVALQTICNAQGWKKSFIKQIRFTQSIPPTLGRSRCNDGQNVRNREYTRVYHAQRKPGIFFLFLKDVLSALYDNKAIYKMVCAQIDRDCNELYNLLFSNH